MSIVLLDVNTLHNSNPFHVTNLDTLRWWVRKLIFMHAQNDHFQSGEL